jgi:ribosomal-protein-alanine N-acetyltransferase
MANSYKIKIRPFNLSDCKSLATHANNRLIWEKLRDRFPHPYTEMDAIQFIQIVSNNSPISEFAIDVNGDAVGAAGIIIKDDIYKGNGEIGYWIGQDYWGKGVATYVVGELVRLGFDKFKLYRLSAEVFENNIASTRVLEKNGFTKEATLKHAITKNGVRLNLNIFSILNPKSISELH